MKIFKTIKFAGLAAIVMTVAVGCASTQQEEPTSDTGPSAADKAIAAAAAACKKAASVGGEWRDVGKFIKQAKAAAKAGDDAKAIKLADKARVQCELGYEQAIHEQALFDAKNKVGNNYIVSAGDNLWSISGKDSVYGNPYQWPLLYKANRDIIKDADLIFPGQDLSIDRAASAGDIDAAVNHAKTRGAWSVGPVEASDTAYLNR